MDSIFDNLTIGNIMKALKVLIVSLIMFGCHFAAISSASAASAFDNFPIANDWTIQSNTCPPVDLRYTWSSIVADQVPAAHAQIVANGTNGGWYVSRQVNIENSVRSLVIMIVKAENSPSSYTIGNHPGDGGWLGNSGNQWLYTTTEGVRTANTFDLRIVLDASCQPHVESHGYAGAGYSELSPWYSPTEYMGMPDLSGRPFIFRNYIMLAVGDFVAPAGYEGPAIPDTVPAPRYYYVAMGDSFSSGEGNPTFEPGTNDDGVNECHRSPQAYPRLLQGDSTLSLGSTAFVACSGATTSDVLYGDSGEGNWNEGPQTDALSADTELVTITIGGNDIGFGEFAEACLHPLNGECDEFTPVYASTMSAINGSLQDDVEAVIEEVLTATNKSADVYVLGYPHLAPAPEEIYEEEDCPAMFAPFGNPWGNRDAARAIVDALNATLEAAVDEVALANNLTRVIFVDTSDDTFVGHDSCSSQPYFNLVDYMNNEYSVHPNTLGQSALKEEVLDALSN